MAGKPVNAFFPRGKTCGSFQRIDLPNGRVRFIILITSDLYFFSTFFAGIYRANGYRDGARLALPNSCQHENEAIKPQKNPPIAGMGGSLVFRWLRNWGQWC
jgi:hypothetical protein